MNTLMYPEMTIGRGANIPEDLLQLGVRARIVEEMACKIRELKELKAKQTGLARIRGWFSHKLAGTEGL